jgi:hypothetical protein
VPGINPLIVLNGELGTPNTAAEGPDKTDQAPVPEPGVLPARAVLVTLHKDWSGPALAVLGRLYTTTSVESVLLQAEAEIAVMWYRTVEFALKEFVRRSVMVFVAEATALEELPLAEPEITEEVQV